jgi:hypothetical protein
MTTLHIEHAISDFAVWSAAFERFADVRRAAGVRGHDVRRPVDDDHHVVIDLDVDTVEHATAFLAFLRTEVWASPSAAPALIGAVDARVLETVASSRRTQDEGVRPLQRPETPIVRAGGA